MLLLERDAAFALLGRGDARVADESLHTVSGRMN
jgi:hypothetical protein